MIQITVICMLVVAGSGLLLLGLGAYYMSEVSGGQLGSAFLTVGGKPSRNATMHVRGSIASPAPSFLMQAFVIIFVARLPVHRWAYRRRACSAAALPLTGGNRADQTQKTESGVCF